MRFIYEIHKMTTIDNDPYSFLEAINGDNFDEWLYALKNEFKSMVQNGV